ncbi:hypothetical protein [Aureimonas sp. AU40]|uniref:hypothetical protein n=1 Tax=Aureimonas sp. AU40 TaxID=1637747 RepID=UPI0007835C5C|nr:hypothetical protein [Aureimonas sp. AU40]
MRADFPFSPPTGWVPSDHSDEWSPPPRDTPNAWILARSNSHAEIAQALLAGPNEGEGHPTGRTKIAAGEIVTFLAYFDLGTTDILVSPDGTWSSADTLPIAPSATMFCEEGDGETLAYSLDELAQNFANNTILSEPEMVTVELFHWSEDVPFVLAISQDGTLGFRQIVDEPEAAEEVEADASREPETADA